MRIIIIILTLYFSINNIGAQSLQDYLIMAEQDNPLLTYHDLGYEISNEKIEENGILNDTKFSVGYFMFPPETRLGPQRLNLRVQQSFPWPGTLHAQKELAKVRSREYLIDEPIEKNNLFYQIKQLYYKLYANAAKLIIYKENKEILRIYEQMALGALENNKSKMSDVLKIGIQKNELHSKIYSNINDKEALENQFNRLININEATTVNVIDTLSILDIIMERNQLENHPSFDKLYARINTNNSEKELLKFERKPIFSTALNYISVSKRNNIELPDNGRDIFMPQVGVSIPLFNEQFVAKGKRLDLEQRQIEVEKLNQTKRLKNAFDKAESKINNAILKVVAAQKNKDQIQRAIDSDLKTYETGKLDYDNILNMQLQKIKYQLMEVDATMEAYIQVAMRSWINGGY